MRTPANQLRTGRGLPVRLERGRLGRHRRLVTEDCLVLPVYVNHADNQKQTKEFTRGKEFVNAVDWIIGDVS